MEFCIACKKFLSPIKFLKFSNPTNVCLFVIPPIRYNDILNTFTVGIKINSANKNVAGARQAKTNLLCALFLFINRSSFFRKAVSFGTHRFKNFQVLLRVFSDYLRCSKHVAQASTNCF